jgi:peptide/nickel transport system substrate-binding protein
MAKSAYPDGFAMTIQYPVGYEFYKQLTLLIQQQLAAIGINVKLEEVSAATAVEKLTAREYEAIFPFPVTSSDSPLPDEYAGFYALPSSETKGFYTGWEDPAIAKKVLRFQSTTDERSRAKQWPVIQRELLEEGPAINVMDVPFINAHGTAVCGTAVSSLGIDRLEFTWLAEKTGS